MAEAQWCFLGGGNMATAILRGFATLEGFTPPRVVDPLESIRERHTQEGRPVNASVDELSGVSRMVLAVKPQQFSAIKGSVRRALAPNALVVSIMVGIGSDVIEAAFPGTRVVRVMPNTPMAVGLGMSGIAPGSAATDEDMDAVEVLCGASGGVLRVRENQIDDVAAISGSGPAYFYRFCEVLVEHAMGVCGFTREEANLLVAKTAEGSIAYLNSHEGFPAARLRKEVTSPGGTTQAALAVFEAKDLDGLVEEGLRAAKSRAAELNALARETGD